MRTNKKLLSNMIYSGVFQLLFLITPVITIPYVSRIFSPSDLGLYATSYAVVIFLVQIASFGMPLYGTRAIAQANNKKEQSQLLANLWIIQITATFIIFLLYCLFSYLLIKERKIYLVQGLLLLTNLFDISWFYRGIEEIKKTIFRNLISKIIAILLIYTLVKNETHFVYYIVINIFGVLIGNLSMVFQLRKYIDFSNLKPKIHYHNIRSSFDLLIPQSIESGKGMLPKIILVWLGTYKEAGLLDQGLKITNILSGIFYSIVNSMIPRLSYLASNKRKDEIEKLVYLFTIVIVIISSMVISGTLAISEFFVPLFFGKGYNGVIPIMNIVIFSILFSPFSYFFGQGLLLSFSQDKKYQRIIAISGVVLVIFSFLLAKPLGGIGISIAYILSELIIMIMSLYYSRRVINMRSTISMLPSTPLLIVINYFITSRLKQFLPVSNNFIGLLIFGGTSVIISIGLSIIFLKLIKFDFKKIKKTVKNNR